MKKLFLLFIFLLMSILPCFAQDDGYVPLPECKPIPSYYTIQYKQDIEQFLLTGIPKAKQELDDIVLKSYELRTKLLNKKVIKVNDTDYIDMLNLAAYENYIKPFNNLYSNIISITNKYLSEPITDKANTEHYVWCYFEDNNLNQSRNNDLSMYLQSCLNKIKRYTMEVEQHIDYKLNSQYKQDIETAIKKEIPIAKEEIDKIYIETEEIYKKALQDRKNIYDYIEQLSQYMEYIESPEFHLYGKLIDVTRKYTYISEDKTGTDWIGTLLDTLNPFIKANGINLDPIKDVSEYYTIKQKNIEIMLKDLENKK